MEPTREFRVYSTSGGCSPSSPTCAAASAHYTAIDDLWTWSNSETHVVRLQTLVDPDHGTEDRGLRIVLQDTHTLRGHVNTDEPVVIEPPSRGTN